MSNPRNPSRRADRPIDPRRLYWEIGFRIRTARDAIGISQSVLGRRAGLSRVSVTNIELGKQRLPLHVLYQIAVAMGIEPHRLVPSKAELRR